MVRRDTSPNKKPCHQYKMATVTLAKMLDETGNFKVHPAGVVGERPKMPATSAIPLHPLRAPAPVKVESGIHAAATKVPFGHVMISKYPKHFAGMDHAGFMS